MASDADPSLFIFTNGLVCLYLLIYVDDILITRNDPHHITRLIMDLDILFFMKDLGWALSTISWEWR